MSPGTRMTCRDAIALFAGYFDATLTPPALERLAAHLRGCDACQAYLATYGTTRRLAAAAGRVEMPAELKQRLRDFLLEHLRDGQMG